METKQKARVAILIIPDKTDLKTKVITRDKEGPSNSLLGIYPKTMKTLFHKDISTTMGLRMYYAK